MRYLAPSPRSSWSGVAVPAVRGTSTTCAPMACAIVDSIDATMVWPPAPRSRATRPRRRLVATPRAAKPSACAFVCAPAPLSRIAPSRTWSRSRRGEVHEVGVHGAKRGGVDAESLGGAGTESLEDEIRASCEFVDECEALGGREVDADALLALHHLRPSGFGEGHDGPDRVTVERLHLDHPGPEVGEQRRAEWCGVQDRQLEHRDPGKRKVGGRVA